MRYPHNPATVRAAQAAYLNAFEDLNTYISSFFCDQCLEATTVHALISQVKHEIERRTPILL